MGLNGKKLVCPKCGKKAKPRKYFEDQQAECQNQKCGYRGKLEEFVG